METDVGQSGWIARKPGMRSAASVSQQLHRLDGDKVGKRLTEPMRDFLKSVRAE